MQVLGLDVGTSSVKAAVLDVATAEPLGEVARAAYDLDQPTPDTATLPCERLWRAVVEAARHACAGHQVEAIGLSCLTPGLVLLGAHDEPLTPIVTHLDRRARLEARQVWTAVGPEFLATVGNKPLPGGITAIGYHHLVRHDPILRTKVRKYLHVNSWLGLRLTGTTAFDPGNASFTGLFDTLTTRTWSPRWCSYFEVDPRWLPPVLSGDATLGRLTSVAAAELGLAGDSPVKLGVADTSSAMLAAGMGPDDLLHVVGTTQVLAVLAKNPQPAPNRLTRLLGVGDAFIQVMHNPVGGVALDWLHDLCFREQAAEQFYGQTVPLAMQRQTEVLLDPPFLGGDRLEIEPQRAAFRELGLSTGRLDLLAAILQAMRTHHQEAWNILVHDRCVRRVFLTGGGADIVRSLIPDYGEREVVMLEEASLRGTARLF